MVDSIVDISEALNNYGPALVITSALLFLNAFFIWKDYRRENRQEKEVEELQRVHNEIVLPLLTECKEAIASCKEVIKQNSQIINSWLSNGRR